MVTAGLGSCEFVVIIVAIAVERRSRNDWGLAAEIAGRLMFSWYYINLRVLPYHLANEDSQNNWWTRTFILHL